MSVTANCVCNSLVSVVVSVCSSLVSVAAKSL